MEPWFPLVSIGLLNQLLHLLGKSGKVESMMKVLDSLMFIHAIEVCVVALSLKHSKVLKFYLITKVKDWFGV